MRIAHVVANAPHVIEQVLAPSTVLVTKGHEVEVLLLDDVAPGAPQHHVRDGVVLRRFATFPARRSIAIRRVREHLRNRPIAYDVVHVHGLTALPAVEEIPLRRLVLSPRLTGLAASRLGLVLRLLQPHRPFDALARSAPIVCTCRGEAEQVQRAMGAAAHLTVVPPAVDVAALHASEPYDVEADVVLVAGRLERRTRVDRVIAAMAALPPRFELVVVGTGPTRRSLESFADDLGLGRRVRFLLVDRAATRRWLRTASVVASMAEHETDVAPLYDALGAGAPVVAAATPAHADLVRFAATGAVRFVSPRTSPLAIADALEEQADRSPVLTHPALLPTPGEVADQLLAVYEATVERRTPPAGRPHAGRA